MSSNMCEHNEIQYPFDTKKDFVFFHSGIDHIFYRKIKTSPEGAKSVSEGRAAPRKRLHKKKDFKEKKIKIFTQGSRIYSIRKTKPALKGRNLSARGA